MRQIIISLLGLLLIGGAVLIARNMANKSKPIEKKTTDRTLTVFTEKVQNKTTPVTVVAGGNLAAQRRIELFAEVQGIFEHSDKRFDPGVAYQEGEVLLRINSDEHRANLRAQKSSLYNQLVAMLPDLRFDYGDAYQKWENYANAFDEQGTLRPLPTPDSDREKLFIAGRNINTLWHNVKNLEERLAKYTIYAPYYGILTEALVDKGALVRAGQKLGTFISPTAYELEVALNAEYADWVKVGNAVQVYNVERTKQWKGTISRINSLINPSTQTLQAFIRVEGKGLREGMYLEAQLNAKSIPNTVEVSRKLLVENRKLFTVQDSLLRLVEVEPVFFKENTVVLRGLADQTEIVSRSVPGAYEGMKVRVFDERKTETGE